MSGWHPIDSPEPAPLLTAEMAASLLDWTSADNEMHATFQALADGRTVNVRVLTEDECRAEFIAHYGEDYMPMYGTREWLAWLASRRAMGAVR